MPHKDKEVRKAYYRKYYQEHKRQMNESGYKWKKKQRKKLKEEVLTHYGGDKLACVWCGFDDIRALSLDHMNNDGYRVRKYREFTGDSIYYYLKKQGYPTGYQTLCMNCQFIKKELVKGGYDG